MSENMNEKKNTAGSTGSPAEAGKSAVKNSAGLQRKKSGGKWVPGPNLPNQLTILRVFMIPAFVAVFLAIPKSIGSGEASLGDILAAIIFIAASLTDTADGYIARKYNYVTVCGKVMDPLADMILVCSAMICLVDLGRIESWSVIIIIAREFIISGFRLIAVEKGKVIAANYWGMFKTASQMVMVILLVADLGGFFDTLGQIFKWIALALTVISLVSYLMQNKEVLRDSD